MNTHTRIIQSTLLFVVTCSIASNCGQVTSDRSIPSESEAQRAHVNFKKSMVGAVVCSSPDVHLRLENLGLLIRSWSSFVDGNGGLDARITGTPHAFTKDSGCPGGPRGFCKVQGCFSSSIPAFAFMNASCSLIGIEIFKDTIVIPSPLQLASQIPIALPDQPVPNEKGEIAFEFGSFLSGRWFPDPRSPHLNSCCLAPTSHLLYFNSAPSK